MSTDVGHPNRWAVLWIMCGSLVLVVVSVSSLNVAIPAIQLSLGASGSELQWIIDAYALTFAGFLLPAGAIGDRYGRRGALVAGLVIFLLASLAGMWAESATVLVTSRAVMGIGAAFVMPATLSIVTAVFPVGERGRAIAIWAGFAGAGGVVGLLSSGFLLREFWWGSIFAVNLPIVIALLVAVVLVVPTSRDPESTPLDPVGGGLSVVGLIALVFGIIEGAERGWTDDVTVIAFVLAVAALAAFVAWELRIEHPMLDPRYFRDRRFSLGSVAITLAFFGIFGMFFVVTQFLQFVQGHDALGAGLRILPYGIVLMIVAPRAAAIAERFGDRKTIAAGMVISAVGFAVFAFLDPDAPAGLTIAGLVLVAIGTGLMMPPATTAIVVSLPPAKAGVGSAMNDTTREVGGALGIALVGALLSVGYRRGLGDVATQLDARDADLVEDSLGGLLAVARGQADESSVALVERGFVAFTDGMALGMGVAALAVTAGAILVALVYPRHATSDDDSSTATHPVVSTLHTQGQHA